MIGNHMVKWVVKTSKDFDVFKGFGQLRERLVTPSLKLNKRLYVTQPCTWNGHYLSDHINYTHT